MLLVHRRPEQVAADHVAGFWLPEDGPRFQTEVEARLEDKKRARDMVEGQGQRQRHEQRPLGPNGETAADADLHDAGNVEQGERRGNSAVASARLEFG